MIKPTIHLNGTPGADLRDAYLAACNATQAAMKALAKTHPNGRDYYTQGEGAFSIAVAEHADRGIALRKVADQLLELYEHCDLIVTEQEKRKAERRQS